MPVIDPKLRPLIEALVKRRMELGYPQWQVDEIAEWPDRQCSKFENGTRVPTAQRLVEWSKALGLMMVQIRSPGSAAVSERKYRSIDREPPLPLDRVTR